MLENKYLECIDDCHIENSSEIVLAMHDFITVDNSMWFVSQYCNFLFRMSLDTYIVDKTVRIPDNSAYLGKNLKLFMKSENEIVLMTPNKYFIYNIKDENIVSTKCDDMYLQFWRISEMNEKKIVDKLWFWDKNKCEYYGNEKFPQEYEIIDNGNKKDRIGHIVDIDDNLYLFPIISNMILKVNLKDKTINQYGDKIDINPAWYQYSVAQVVDEKIYAFIPIENAWQIIDVKLEQSVKKKVIATEDVKHMVCDSLLFYEDYNGCVIPNHFVAGEGLFNYTLSRFVEAIIKSNTNYEEKNISTNGKQIYREMIK